MRWGTRWLLFPHLNQLRLGVDLIYEARIYDDAPTNAARFALDGWKTDESGEHGTAVTDVTRP